MAGLLPNLIGLGNVTFINNFLSSVGVLVSVLPEQLQNGNSSLGLVSTPVLPPFLGGSPGIPWGNMTAGGTNVYEQTPDTGVTRYYDFEVSRATLAPEGIPKPMMVVNGQFPGPLIEANWGDMIQVTVKNSISGPEEGTALHWHGLLQKETPWYDGVPSVQMCPIAPGESFTYKFRADLYGSSWWHSHYSAQYAGGLQGPMVIHGPTDNYPKVAGDVIDLGPVIVCDSYFTDYYTLVEETMSNNSVIANFVTSRNTLIQGKGNVDCTTAPAGANCTSNAGLAKFTFKRGKTHLLRLINTSSAAFMIVSLDDHDMTVVANDYVAVKPYTVTQVQLNVGQRTDVLITANQRPNAYWLRTRQAVLCNPSTQPFALAAVYYDGISTTRKPTSLPQLDFIEPTLINCGNDALSLTEPYYPIKLDPPDVQIVVRITHAVNSTGYTHFLVNNQTFRGNYNYPLLNLTYNGNTSYPYDPQWNVYNFGRNETIRIIWETDLPFGHPMHVHGQNMYVVDEGVGAYNGVNTVRPSNPQRRDTQSLKPSGYLVVQLVSNNPGVWPFHCHIAWHVSQGLYINVMQKPDQVVQPQIPQVVSQSCDAWWRYTDSGGFVNQIDSGLKLKEKKRL